MDMNEKKDVWQGTVALMVLRTVAVLGPQHGYGIAKRIEQVSAEMPASAGRLGEAWNLSDSHSLAPEGGSHACADVNFVGAGRRTSVLVRLSDRDEQGSRRRERRAANGNARETPGFVRVDPVITTSR